MSTPGTALVTGPWSLGEICQSISSVKVPIKGFLVSITKSHVSTPLSMCRRLCSCMGVVLGGPVRWDRGSSRLSHVGQHADERGIGFASTVPLPGPLLLGNCFVALFLSLCLRVLQRFFSLILLCFYALFFSVSLGLWQRHFASDLLSCHW